MQNRSSIFEPKQYQVMLGAAILCYAIACPLPCYQYTVIGKVVLTGWECLTKHVWDGPWPVNPLLFISWVCILMRLKVAKYWTIAAALIALTTDFRDVLPASMLWFGSIALSVVASFQPEMVNRLTTPSRGVGAPTWQTGSNRQWGANSFGAANSSQPSPTAVPPFDPRAESRPVAIKLRCRACSSLNDEAAKFCSNCGGAL